MAGLLAVAAVPGGVAVAETVEGVELIDAAAAVPVGMAAGLLALWLAHRARVRVERTLGRVGGAATARVGTVLGTLGIMVAAAGAIALLTYLVLSRYAE